MTRKVVLDCRRSKATREAEADERKAERRYRAAIKLATWRQLLGRIRKYLRGLQKRL